MKKHLLLLWVACAATCAASAAITPLAKLQGSTLTFYAADDSEAESENVYKLNFNASYGWRDDDGSSDALSSVESVVFDPSFAQVRPTSTANLFYKMSRLTSITGMENLNTEDVTDMDYMFYGCQSLASVDVSHFNTSKVTSMRCMFGDCYSLTSLDLTSFNTSQVVDMYGMFINCANLSQIALGSNFDTGNVTNMMSMFTSCQALTSVDVSHFNTSKVKNISCMFQYCSSLTSLDLTGFNTSQVEYMTAMFEVCSGLTSLDLSGFDTKNVQQATDLCRFCSSLRELNLGKNDFTHIGTSQSYFRGVGTAAAPCKLIVDRTGDDGFNIQALGEAQQNAAGEQYYQWLGGYFKLNAGVPTGVTQVNAAEQQLDANAPAFNLQGQRVSGGYRGVVVQNGRKFIRK